MARIVLGLGSSHSPQVSSGADWWADHGARDSRNPRLLGRDGEFHTFDEICAVEGWTIGAERLTTAAWESLNGRIQGGVARLKHELEQAVPDLVVVIGDDQQEMFRYDGIPAFAVYYGATAHDIPPSAEARAKMPKGIDAAMWATHSDEGEEYEVPADLGRHIIGELVTDEFDVTAVAEQLPGRGVGHAYTFVRRRLMGETMIPILPVAVNAYYPPNQPSPKRCYMFGRALRRAIESYPDDLRVAVAVSGGLSHFVVDEELDHRVLEGLRTHDVEVLSAIPRRFMRSGTGEILNWIVGGACLEGLTMEIVDYVAAYRSTAGTGVGMGFVTWKP